MEQLEGALATIRSAIISPTFLELCHCGSLWVGGGSEARIEAFTRLVYSRR